MERAARRSSDRTSTAPVVDLALNRHADQTLTSLHSPSEPGPRGHLDSKSPCVSTAIHLQGWISQAAGPSKAQGK